jgi:hypothetical protein
MADLAIHRDRISHERSCATKLTQKRKKLYIICLSALQFGTQMETSNISGVQKFMFTSWLFVEKNDEAISVAEWSGRQPRVPADVGSNTGRDV